MSEYNNLFDFNATTSAVDLSGSPNQGPTPAMDQSGSWNTALYPQFGLMEGCTAAQLHAPVDFAPFGGAKSNGAGIPKRVTPIYAKPKPTCAVCRETFQTAFALENHAKEAIHQAYKCKCGTGFNRHSALRRHIDTKDAPKTFACILCYEKFNRKDKLHDHCRHYHKVTDEGMRTLFSSQESRPRPTAARRRRAPAPLAAASSGSVPPPTPAPASVSVGLSAWGPAVNAGQQFASLSAGDFISAETCVPAGPSVRAADPFSAAPVPDEDFAELANEIFGNGIWATNIDDLTF
ncbi:hypothetical protein N8I77_003036 [Diaporthe amygdali]|uniref:C2H2-type domain-containing protein n=1 Tax=Phomopsis amygdali TaxID=1214568 RepID=A0AAD9SH67_PHOAM|nr:hypothetical protein N8I77_003036 [Diaporthe amygdali]